MDVKQVMVEVGARLADQLSALTVYDYPTDGVPPPPAAIVSYPDEITFDETYGRGMDVMTITVTVVVGRVDERSTRDVLTAYCAGSGTSSVKQVLETGTYTAFDAIRVESVDFSAITAGTNNYVAATFSVSIGGSGSS